MELSRRIDELEAELKIVKNEVQTVLLDIRERVLSHYDNPFQVIETAPPKKAGEDAVVGAAAPVMSEPPVEKRSAESSEGAKKMEETVGPNQLKALADQLESQKQAFEQYKREALSAQPPTPLTSQAPFAPAAQAMPGIGSMPMSGAPWPAMPVFPMAQPMQGMAQQPIQLPPVVQGAQPPQQHHHFQAGHPKTKPPMGRGGEGTPTPPPEGRGPAPGQQGARPGLRRAPGEKEGTAGMEKPGLARQAHPADLRRSEVKMEQREKPEKKDEKAPAAEETQVNLMTLIGLVRWVEKSIKKVGKERVQAIVEIYRTAGYLPASCKDIIPQVIRLAEDEKPDGAITMGDSINVLLQLDSLLGGKFKTESAVLSTLFDEDGGYPWTKQ
ncbi:MAG: hypothetical protein FJZ95_02575 [Chloroflexi bacterium]|nr:hypothetical protein [Chloroflexota bacterium]